MFVSHLRQDQSWVTGELLPTLEGRPPMGRGLHFCLLQWDFEPGKDVDDKVADGMAGSWVTLCVLSRQALHTPRCCLDLCLAAFLLLAAPHPQGCCWSSWSWSPATSSLVALGCPGCSAEKTTACGPRKMKERTSSGLGWGAGWGSLGWARVGACVLEVGGEEKQASPAGREWVRVGV